MSKSAKKETKKSDGFTAEEKAAMKERAKEMKAEERANKTKADGEKDLLEKVAEMQGLDRTLATHIHTIVTATAPDLFPKTWYGMPAYARDGKIVCFFQSAQKFESRYATLGFNDTSNLDDGAMWATAFALVEWTDAVEAKITELVKKAVS